MPIQTAIDSINNNQGSPFGFKNRIINGAMVIDQRNAGSTVTVTNTNPYTLDRWIAYNSVASSKYTVQQSSTAPAGFTNSLLVTSSSAYSIAAGNYFLIDQVVEGYNWADLAWGTADAKTVTLSFWVRSSLTGTFGGAFKSYSGSVQSYPFTYTINAANTWEQKSITVAGPTSTWASSTTNGGGVEVLFSLGTGSTYSGTAGSWAASSYFSATGATSVVGTSGATWYVTGVQLEKGSTATSFDYRPYGTELALCQRYYQQIGKSNNVSYQPYGTGVCTTTTAATLIINLPVMMRGTPTFTFNGATNTFTGSVGTAATSVISDIMSPTTIMYQAVVASGLVAGNGARHYQSATSASSLELSAEL